MTSFRVWDLRLWWHRGVEKDEWAHVGPFWMDLALSPPDVGWNRVFAAWMDLQGSSNG
jgi:hypothetical protein